MPRSPPRPWLPFRRPCDGPGVGDQRVSGAAGGQRAAEQGRVGAASEKAPTQRNERAIACHPSLKPQAFLRQVVRAILPCGEGIVLDPFAGSGATLAAAEFVGYASVGVEVNPDYTQMARHAIPQLAAYGRDAM